MRKYPYKHIKNGEIQSFEVPHPYDNTKNKTIFMQQFVFDLRESDFDVSDYTDISNGKNNLFKLKIDKIDYNVFIEHPDGGGADITRNETRKKISIPYNQSAFKKLVDEYERLIVVNIYYPLDNNNNPSNEERIYLFVDPEEIYSSKVIKNHKKNPSSRWIDLKDIISIDAIKANRKNNVFILRPNMLMDFFKEIFLEKYINMIRSELHKISVNDLTWKDNRFKKHRKLFKKLLVQQRGFEKCEIKNCDVNISKILIASHIKPVHAINNDPELDSIKKLDEISDPHNGFLLCPNHDALFDKFFITFNEEGNVKFSTIIKDISIFGMKTDVSQIDISNKTLKYLAYHNKAFDEQTEPRVEEE
jgi:hypothetical protein